jgi:hypothetical protein
VVSLPLQEMDDVEASMRGDAAVSVRSPQRISLAQPGKLR